MRIPTRLLLLPLVMALPSPAAVTADSATVTVRWNGLVTRFVEEAAASRRAARAAATAAGDSAALRRIAQTQPPLLMRVYALLSVAQYAAGSSARAGRSATR